MKVKIDDDIADKIVLKSIKEHIKMSESEIYQLLTTKNLQEYQKRDLKDATYYLNALAVVYEYYGGYLE